MPKENNQRRLTVWFAIRVYQYVCACRITTLYVWRLWFVPP